MKKRYIPLHVHSEYSLLDGLSKVSDISERMSDIEVDTCAITDHGSVSGAVDFSSTLNDNGQKPILGCEFYICKKDKSAKDKGSDNRSLDHQVILAKNYEGWKDILHLVSLSNTKDRYYYRPRIDLDDLATTASKGNLITFSGHLGSTLSNYIMNEDSLSPDWESRAIYFCNYMQEIFGKENFFLEIQLIDSKINKKSKIVAEALRDIASKYKIKKVATPDAHYPTREDAIDQRVLLSIHHKKTIPQIMNDIKNGTCTRSLISSFSSNNYHIPSYEDMTEFHTEDELENTINIADMCEKYSILHNPDPPNFDCPDNMNDNDYLRHLCREGWRRKMSHISPKDPLFKEYGERVNYELDVFTSINLSSYFLVIADILNYVRSENYITGPGRGSAAGCMVSYLLDITQIDPIPYNLVFERFYNPGRNTPGKISWPDIDFDIPKESGEKALNYIREKYGDQNVAQIITFQTLKGRAALKRVMAARGDISFSEQNFITSSLVDENKIADELEEIEKEYGYASAILWALENNASKLKRWCEIDNGKLVGPLSDVFEQAIRLEKVKVSAGKHAAGIIVSRKPISESCPMVLDKDESMNVAGFEGPSCEMVGLLKLDCLRIRMLDKIMDISKIITGE
jgi:DNA polymerase III subunit alpha